jgi:hypothetical protein
VLLLGSTDTTLERRVLPRFGAAVAGGCDGAAAVTASGTWLSASAGAAATAAAAAVLRGRLVVAAAVASDGFALSGSMGIALARRVLRRCGTDVGSCFPAAAAKRMRCAACPASMETKSGKFL